MPAAVGRVAREAAAGGRLAALSRRALGRGRRRRGRRGGACGAASRGRSARSWSAATSSARSRSRCARGARSSPRPSSRRPASRRRSPLGETDAAVEMGLFVAGEGRRYYGRTTTASMAHRTVMAVRQPVGVAGLHHLVQHAAAERRLEGLSGDPLRQRRRPQAFGGDAALGAPLRAQLATRWGCRRACSTSSRGSARRQVPPSSSIRGVDLVSFTGSAATGRWIAETAGRRLAKVCLELGGKNALVVCDDADLDNAVRWAVQSSFSNAGQRCAAASADRRLRRGIRGVPARASSTPLRRSRTPGR